MNDMTIHVGKVVTMTSLELVEFINSQRHESEAELRHDHFMAKVPKVLGDMAPKFSGTIEKSMPNGGTRNYSIYTFPKREACLMAMSYSYDLQAKVFDRMTELESRPIDPLQFLNNPAALRGLLQSYTEKVISLQSKVDEQKPKIEALDRIKSADGMLCFRDTAKTLGVLEKPFKLWLLSNEWCYVRPGKNRLIGRSEKIAMGYLDHKLTSRTFPDGTTEEYSQMVFTPRGIARLAEIFAKNRQLELV